ncbi:MAG: sensor domain-containing diguanylate cyclase [Burkholderiaceae bacterium]
MRSRSALHTLVLDSLADPVAIIDRSGAIVDLNAAWLRFAGLLGMPARLTRMGGPYIELLAASGVAGDRHVAGAIHGIERLLADRRRELRFEYPMNGPGTRRWMLMRGKPLESATEPLFVVTHIDITARRRAEDEAWQLAHHDPLTGLANRRRFDETLDIEIRRSMRKRTPISLVVVDVDSFKEYNDTHGHVGGDRCLVRIAEVLSRFSRRPGDLAARLGGDEFALILGETGDEAARQIAQGIRRSVEALGMSLRPSGEAITVSVGAVTAGAPLAEAPRELFDVTDRALYRAKLAGRNRAVHHRIDTGLPNRADGGLDPRAVRVP